MESGIVPKSLTVTPGILLLVSWLLLLSQGCGPAIRDSKVTDVPVAVLASGTQEVDFGVVVEDVTKRVHELLPRTQFQGVVFAGKLQDLPGLHGTLVLSFAQVSQGLLGRKVVRATVVVNTDSQTADFSYEDVSALYPSTRSLPLPSDRVLKEVAAAAHQHAVELGLPDDQDMTLTQRAGVWDVRCGPLQTFESKCSFGVNGAGAVEPVR